ncbi:hypothetical protein QVD17_04985 [Tagetes erecta]|uniref:BZIP domain-containing protein n=1 Tax=Tagetes erecta TaxID=13708 RepID=A0AAD8P506_TARER|nr:hypothetical protein QVD17_04985 [Tagetes erecta]
MSPVISEALLSGSTAFRRHAHLLQSFSVIFLYCYFPVITTTYVHFGYLINIMAACGERKFTESTQLDDHQDSALRKRKRMISNRESARRSRVRKRKHMGDLVLEVSQLVSDNKYMAINLKDTTQLFLNLESENSVLRTQLAELTRRFESLTNIINVFSSSLGDDHETEASMMCGVDDELFYCDNMHLYDSHQFMVDMS